ncbi:DUF1836 domain-containing protein [Limosilactobacillus avium]|uniref:DUF1836 domain-containing protein n=1 Tax=Limosilactobacillus avium TaxID=2991831 RepID=UPI0024B8E560|nr:DUF1836 domain-containing protein [Limosilactobacillus avium]
MVENNQYRQWQEQLAHVKFPRWKELPALGLYIDQVVTIVNEQLSGVGVEPLTKSMVNNYVKKKIIQAPVKKKYAVNQLVDLLVIGFFKSSFSIEEIRRGIAQATLQSYPQQAYDRFVTILDQKLAGKKVAVENADAQTVELTSLAIDAVLAHLKAIHLVREMRCQQAPQTVAKKK